VVTRPASSLVQDRESTPAETSVLTTMLRRLTTMTIIIIIQTFVMCTCQH